MGSFLLRLRSWWETADRTQRVVTIFGSAFLALLIGGTVYFASRPKMGVLYSGLSPEDVGTITQELTKRGVPNQLEGTNIILVPSDKVAQTQADLAAAGKMPSTGRGGNADLNDMGSFLTPGVEREKLLAAKESELAKTIEELQGVQSARVHIVIGNTSGILSDKRPSTASVTIVEKAGYPLGQEQGRVISSIVSRSVQDLDAKDISVATSQGRLIWDGQKELGPAAVADTKARAESQEAERRRRNIQAYFDSAFGPGATIVSVNCTMGFDEKTVDATEQTPSDNPSQLETREESLNGSVGGAGGPAGITSNTPSAPATGSASTGSDYKGTQKSSSFPTNVKTSRTTFAVGEVTSMSINVLVDSTVVQSDQAIRDYVAGELGPKNGDPNFTTTVTSYAFNKTAQAESAKAAAAAVSGSKMQQYFSLLPLLALAVVGFMVVRSLAKVGSATDVRVVALPGGQLSPAGALPLSTATGSGATSQPMPVFQPTLERKITEVQPEVEINAIPEAINVPLEQIKKMSREKPEMVAMLLKSWMLEEAR